MRYLIENLIIYDSSCKTLENVNYTDAPIELSPGSVAVLLEFFLSHPETIWGKDEISALAFTDTIYSGSDSNVNKCLSILRRTFAEAGGDPGIFKTIPLQGVAFTGKVITYAENDSSTQRNHTKQMVIILGGLLISTIAIFLSVSSYKKHLHQEQQCLLISRGDTLLFEKLRDTIPEIDKCRAPGVIINGVNRFSEKKLNYSLISVCDSKHDECINYIKKKP